MRLILLTRVNRVVHDAYSNWRQAWYIRKAVVADAKERKFVIGKLEDAGTVGLKLLAMFESVQKAVSIGSLHQNPGMEVGSESRNEIEVPIVTRQRNKGGKLRT